MSEDRIDLGLSSLADVQAEIVNTGSRFLRSAGGDIYTAHMLFLAMLQRSYDVCTGITALVEQRNLACAAPLLRLQVDTLARACYVARRASNPDELAAEVLRGTEFRRMKDATGKRLDDGRLIELAKEFHPWIEGVYRSTSGWVHLSPQHMVAAFGVETSDPGAFSMRLPIDPEVYGSSVWVELVDATCRATGDLLWYVQSLAAHFEMLTADTDDRVEHHGAEDSDPPSR